MFRCSALLAFLLPAASPVAAQSESAFALHAGAVYARLPDVDVQKVQTLAGQDLFSLSGVHGPGIGLPHPRL